MIVIHKFYAELPEKNQQVEMDSNVIKLSFSAQKGYSYWKFVTQKCL